MGYNFKRKYGTNTRGGGVDPDPMNFFVNTCLILCINRIIVCIQNNRCRTTVRATVITANRCLYMRAFSGYSLSRWSCVILLSITAVAG